MVSLPPKVFLSSKEKEEMGASSSYFHGNQSCDLEFPPFPLSFSFCGAGRETTSLMHFCHDCSMRKNERCLPALSMPRSSMRICRKLQFSRPSMAFKLLFPLPEGGGDESSRGVKIEFESHSIKLLKISTILLGVPIIEQ